MNDDVTMLSPTNKDAILLDWHTDWKRAPFDTYLLCIVYYWNKYKAIPVVLRKERVRSNTQDFKFTDEMGQQVDWKRIVKWTDIGNGPF